VLAQTQPGAHGVGGAADDVLRQFAGRQQEAFELAAFAFAFDGDALPATAIAGWSHVVTFHLRRLVRHLMKIRPPTNKGGRWQSLLTLICSDPCGSNSSRMAFCTTRGRRRTCSPPDFYDRDMGNGKVRAADVKIDVIKGVEWVRSGGGTSLFDKPSVF
jgi:hypothetical protein